MSRQVKSRTKIYLHSDVFLAFFLLRLYVSQFGSKTVFYFLSYKLSLTTWKMQTCYGTGSKFSLFNSILFLQLCCLVTDAWFRM